MKNLKLILICMLFVIGCDETDELDNIVDGIDDIPLSEDGMIEGSFQFTGVTIYENVECSGTAITSSCDTGDGDIGEISEAQCDSLGGSMLPLINLFTNGDPTCAPYVIFGSDGTFINPECETHSYTIDSTYAVQIDESECEDQDGNDIENISSQAECDSIGGNWDPSLLDGILNIVDSSVIINGSDQGGCDNDEYVNENDCNEAGYDWENPECLQYTLTYAPDHDGTCTGEDLCDDGSDECESDEDCEDGQICDDGECVYYEDGGDECESDEDCEDGQICDDGECIYYEDGGDECESDNNLLNGTFQFTDFVMFDGETCDGEGATGICPADESVTDENACEAICMNIYTYEVIEASDQMECETSGGMWYGWMSYLDILASEDGTNPYIILSDDGSFTNPDCGLGTYSIDSTGTNITIYETECEDQDGNEFDDILTEADCDSIGGDWDVEMIYGSYEGCEMTIEFSDSAGCYDCDGCNDDGSDSVSSEECDAVTTMEECDNLCGYWEEAYCQRMVLTYDPNHDGICIEPDDDECESDDDCMFSESYNDENSNGQYDEGESFNDENGNGQYDYGEECIDGECVGQSSIMFFGKKVNVK